MTFFLTVWSECVRSLPLKHPDRMCEQTHVFRSDDQLAPWRCAVPILLTSLWAVVVARGVYLLSFSVSHSSQSQYPAQRSTKRHKHASLPHILRPAAADVPRTRRWFVDLCPRRAPTAPAMGMYLVVRQKHTTDTYIYIYIFARNGEVGCGAG